MGMFQFHKIKINKYFVNIFYLIISIMFIIANCCNAQILVKAINSNEIGRAGIFPTKAKVPTFYTRLVDDKQLMEEREKVDKNSGLLRFGKRISVSLSTQTSGAWEKTPRGNVWKINIKSVGAQSINLLFDNFKLSDKAEMYIYNKAKTVLMGPIKSSQNNPLNLFGTDILGGDEISIELLDGNTDSLERSHFRINTIVHGFRLFKGLGGFGTSSSCSKNVRCRPEFEKESDAVCKIIAVDGEATASLINNSCNNFKPYILTARHNLKLCNVTEPGSNCINLPLTETEKSAVYNWVYRFQYKTEDCNGAQEPTSWYFFYGSSYRADWFNTDFALLELFTLPMPESDIKYAGWTRTNSVNAPYVGIHHPQGDVMKISIAYKTSYCSLSQNLGYGYNSTDFWSTCWNSGVTEPGSSGSPLFGRDRKILGQLLGGNSSCPYSSGDDYYGGIDKSWQGGGTISSQLNHWLGYNKNEESTETLTMPWVSGGEKVCEGSNVTYRLQDYHPYTGSVNWTAIGFIPSSGTGQVANVTAVPGFSGIGFVTFQYALQHSGCQYENPYSAGKQVYIGAPSDFYISGYPEECNNIPISFQATVDPKWNANSYKWFLDGSFIQETTDPNVQIPAQSNGNHQISLKVGNDCGFSNYETSFGFTIFGCNWFSGVYPNPAADVVNVTIDDRLKESKTIRIINAQGKIFKEVITKNNQEEIDINNIPDGLYTVLIISEKTTKSHHISVRHQ
jgi:lysyl endopeptidase